MNNFFEKTCNAFLNAVCVLVLITPFILSTNANAGMQTPKQWAECAWDVAADKNMIRTLARVIEYEANDIMEGLMLMSFFVDSVYPVCGFDGVEASGLGEMGIPVLSLYPPKGITITPYVKPAPVPPLSAAQIQEFHDIQATHFMKYFKTDVSFDGVVDCEVNFIVVPPGAVIDVVSLCSDDRIAEDIRQAAYDSSPMPSPSDARLFERNFRLNVSVTQND